MLQSRCSKCNLPLEIESRVIGLGPDCKENARLMYIKDCEALANRPAFLSGDTWFNFMSLMGSVQTSAVEPELRPTLDRLATALVSLEEGKLIPFSVILDCFSVARNVIPEENFIQDPIRKAEFIEQRSKDANYVHPITKQIHNALKELGFANFINLASGQTCPGTALLDWNAEMNKITLNATVRRCASEVFNLLDGVTRPATTFWLFPLRHAAIVHKTVLERWPLEGGNVVTPAFLEALERAKNLPPLPPEPPDFTTELIDFKIVRIKRKLEDGRWALDKTGFGAIYNFIVSDLIGGSYYKMANTEEHTAYIVPEEKLELVKQKITEVFAEAKAMRTVTKKVTTRRR